MKQKIYPDSQGIDTWDQSQRTRVFVHIVNSEHWREITGEEPPLSPVTARSYANAGLPWFDLYDEGAPTLAPTGILENVRSTKEMDQSIFGASLQDDDPVPVGPVKKIVHTMLGKLGVNDGKW